MTKNSPLRVLGGATILAGAVAAGALIGAPPAPAPSREARTGNPAGTPPAAPPDTPLGSVPRFDVVRADARGMVVVAGRAAPGARVALHEGERAIAQTLADSRGEWVMLPDEPLGAGPRELSLRARLTGGEEIRGPDTVLVVGPTPAPAPLLAGGPPAPPLPADLPLVLVLPPTAEAAPRALSAPPGPPALGLDVIDYDERDAMRFAGTAPPGARLRVWSDSRHLGDTAADGAGRWSLRPAEPLAPGRHTLQVDQLPAPGARPIAAARIQVAFEREVLPAGGLREGEVVVQPGNNLWRIAREAYGQGIRYTVIYRANQEQIRHPDRIYPGQRLALPAPG
ncbi:LysM peptidoglycan-binding domain-containing protein [Roseomonas nepalensis]|uniref:LysM peptidoglycan-binding domain-containing protein n=1 Tax=Muricoccus nepalensis TaxID=1854500 RepID=A0A502FR46_9PROT|nr:LysM peptidoglycan-binding domain-containing protein [Roseomonas nepalensis]TPG51925.1 LysM peptidoglycan-binding domain-containing protein [Roseomonas nepalensis]